MKTLSKLITKKGFTLKQLERVGDKAIYEQSKSGYTPKSYEVVKIGRHNGYELGGQYIKPAETYPGTSLWGIKGWTYQSLTAAEAKFKKI